MSIWSKEDDIDMTLPDADVPLVYSLHYVQQGPQDLEDELPPEPMKCRKKQEKRTSNLRAEEDFSEKLESMILDPSLSKLIQKNHEFFGVLPPPLSWKNLVQMDLKLKPEFEGSVKEGPYQDRPPLCPFRLLPLLIYSGSTIAFLKILKVQGSKSKNIENVILLQP